ncbi:MAG: ATP-binding protein [Acidimicrobiales bacterium]|nr:ATP-binding protein [Acidimicrobiales bacterium]
MTWFAGDALVVVPPTGDSPGEIATWLSGDDLYPVGRTAFDAETSAWARMTMALAADDDGLPPALRGASDLVVSLIPSGDTLLCAIRGSRAEIELSFGVVGAHRPREAEEVARLVRAAFDGCDARPSPAPDFRTCAAWPTVAVVGVPDTAQLNDANAPTEAPLIERLERAGRGDDWLLLVRVVPIARPAVNAWVADAFGVEAAMHALVNTTENDTYRTQRPAPTPEARRALQLAEDELRRATAAQAQGGVAVEVTLSAPNALTLRAVAGAACTLAPKKLTARALRVAPISDQPLEPAATAMPASTAALFLQPPNIDLPGLEVRTPYRFARHFGLESTGEAIEFGVVVDQTEPSGRLVSVDASRMATHVLAVGMTGSGKTSFARGVIRDFAAAGTGVLVIEPSKGDYGDLADVVWRIGEPLDPTTVRPPFVLNPFEVPPGLPVMTHLDRVAALIEDTLDLPDPIPHLVRQQLAVLYEARGWDLATNTNRMSEMVPDFPTSPTLSDLRAAVVAAVERLYTGEVAMNVRGAASVRLGSLANGPKGLTLDTDRPSNFEQQLLRGVTVVNLDAVGDDREKAFLVGLLLLRLWAARRSQPAPGRLVHATIVEEAHRLLGKPSSPRADTTSAGRGRFTAELASNLLAEIRASGEALFILDQSPRKLIDDVIANTGTKVIFALPHRDDQDAVGAAIGLAEPERRAVALLRPDEPLFFTTGMAAPVLMRARFLRPPAERALPPEDGRRDTALSSPLAEALAAVALSNTEHAAEARAELIALGRPAAALALGRAAEALGSLQRWTPPERDKAARAILDGRAAKSPPDRREPTTCSCGVESRAGSAMGCVLAELAIRRGATSHTLPYTLPRSLADLEVSAFACLGSRHRR